jgi:hypothetical protein
MPQGKSKFTSDVQFSVTYNAWNRGDKYLEISSINYKMIGFSIRGKSHISNSKSWPERIYREETIKEEENVEDIKYEEDKNDTGAKKRGKRKRNRKKKKNKKDKNGDSMTLGEHSDSDYLDNTEISSTVKGGRSGKLEKAEPEVPKYLVKTYQPNSYIEEYIRNEIDKLNDEEFEDLIENFSESIMSPFLSKAAKRKLSKKQKLKPNIEPQWTQNLYKRLESWIWS